MGVQRGAQARRRHHHRPGHVKKPADRLRCLALGRFSPTHGTVAVVFRSAVRKMIELAMPTILEVFACYCHMSSTAILGRKQFQKMIPHRSD